MTSIQELLGGYQKRKEDIKEANSIASEANVDKTEIKKSAEQLIASNRIVVFSKSYCPYCTQAKMALRSIPNLDFVAVEMDDGQHEGWQVCVSEIARDKAIPETSSNNTMSVPQIFVNGQCIGGADDLSDMFTDQRLSKMLGRPLS
eukprot:scaffold5159_cov112-Cylindrotheca_fusiformis.AAC.3